MSMRSDMSYPQTRLKKTQHLSFIRLLVLLVLIFALLGCSVKKVDKRQESELSTVSSQVQELTEADQSVPQIKAIDINKLDVTRDLIIKALEAEGISGLTAGYANIHLLPMYQKKIAYGSHGFPWSLKGVRQDINYTKGICPVAEKLHEKTFIGFEMCVHDLPDNNVDLIVDAFKKVWKNIKTLS